MKRTVAASLMAAGLAVGGAGGASAEASATVHVFVILPVKEAAYEGFMEVMRNNALNSRQEPGNRAFHVLRAEEGGPTVYLVERWADQAAFDQHLQTAHLKAIENALPAATEGGEPTVLFLEEIPEIPAAAAVSDGVTARNIVVMFDTADDTRAAFLDAMAKVVPHARAAPGNVAFDLFQMRDNPNRFVVVERWARAEDHEAYLQADYAAEFNRALDGLLTANPMDNRWVLTELDIAAE